MFFEVKTLQLHIPAFYHHTCYQYNGRMDILLISDFFSILPDCLFRFAPPFAGFNYENLQHPIQRYVRSLRWTTFSTTNTTSSLTLQLLLWISLENSGHRIFVNARISRTILWDSTYNDCIVHERQWPSFGRCDPSRRNALRYIPYLSNFSEFFHIMFWRLSKAVQYLSEKVSIWMLGEQHQLSESPLVYKSRQWVQLSCNLI